MQMDGVNDNTENNIKKNVESGGITPELLSLDQLPEKSSFKDKTGYKRAFVTALHKVVQELAGQIGESKKDDWVLKDGDFDEDSFLGAAGSVSKDDWETYLIDGIRGGDNVSFSGRESGIMMLRVWEEMIKMPGYENLAFYRGANLNEGGSFGMDWAPAGLNEALDYVKRSFGQKRENPGLVSVPFRTVIDAYKMGKLTMELEHGFGTGSATFMLRGEAQKDIKKWRVSGDIPSDNTAKVFVR